jgi:uncharacterized protein YceK
MLNIFKEMLFCIIIASLLGCGTIKTVSKDGSVARSDLKAVKSPCDSIPRIYSGVAYNICALRGKPSRAALWMGGGAELALIDLALSGVLDTAVLPYTIYEQINQGSIKLN